MRKNKFLAALAIAACLATSVPLSANAATVGQAADAGKVTYGVVSDADKAEILKAFDAANYAKENPDVAALFSGDALFNHFITAGIFEARGLNADFNVSAYYSAYGDLQTKIGKDPVKLTMHYLTHGKNENRKLISVKAVTEAGIDVVSLFDGSVVAKGVVASAPTGGSSESSGNTDPEKTVTDASAEELANLKKDLDKYKTDLDKAKDDLNKAKNNLEQLQKDYEEAKGKILTDAEKKELEDKYKGDYEDAKDKADKLQDKADKLQDKVDELQEKVDEAKNAIGNRDVDVEAEKAKYGDNAFAAGGSQTIKFNQASVAYIQNGSVEAKFRENVWYDYKDGKFYTLTKAPEGGVYVPSGLKLKKDYTYVGGKYYLIIAKDEMEDYPYLVHVGTTAKYDTFADRDGVMQNHDLIRGGEDNTGELQYIAINSQTGMGLLKKIQFTADAAKGADPKYDWNYGDFNISDNFLTENPFTEKEDTEGLDPNYWVQDPVSKNWFVRVNEMTTYHTTDGDWFYKKDDNGNNIYFYASIPEDQSDAFRYKGFIRLNTSKVPDHVQILTSPYNREDENGDQYSMKYVAMINDPAAISDLADRIDWTSTSVSAASKTRFEEYTKEIGDAEKVKYILDDQSGYEGLASVTSGSYTAELSAYAQDWTKVTRATTPYATVAGVPQYVSAKERALVNWYLLHYQYGSASDVLESGESDADALRIIHADEYYTMTVDDGWKLCLSDYEGYPVVWTAGYGDGATYARIDGSKAGIRRDQLFVRAFQVTQDYKEACNQNTDNFIVENLDGKFAVKATYAGTVWFVTDYYADVDQSDNEINAGEVNTKHKYDVKQGAAAQTANDGYGRVGVFADNDTNRFVQFATLGFGINTNYEGEVNPAGTWAGETDLYIEPVKFENFKVKDPDDHGYVYVRVENSWTWDGKTETWKIDENISKDRWYKKVTPNDDRVDALYSKDEDGNWYYNRPVEEKVATTFVEGHYEALDPENAYIVTEVTELDKALDCTDAQIGVNEFVQTIENGRFYITRSSKPVVPTK